MAELKHKPKPNDPSHVILHSMLRWFAHRREHADALPVAPDVVIISAMVEQEGPLREYGDQYVASRVNQLKEQGLVEKVTYHGRNVGWRLSPEGVDVLEEMGTPAQYDH